MKSRRSDSQQLVRQWALLRLLSGAKGGYTVKELAEQLRASKPTIERDLATLERQFTLVEQSAGKQKKIYRIDRHIEALDGIRFGTMELLAIYAAHALLQAFEGTPLLDDLGQASHKIRGALSKHHNGGLDALARVVAPHVRGQIAYAPHREQLDELADAIARRRVCKLTYFAAWKRTTREHVARPLRLVSHGAALYLLACLGEHDRVSTLAVHRIRQIEVSAQTFKAPAVDVDAFIAKAFKIFVSEDEQDVEIRFAPDIAWRIEEHTFHPAEIKERLPDGSLRYRIKSSAQWEIVPWVRSYGELAELVAPASWRASVLASAEAVVARYRTS